MFDPLDPIMWRRLHGKIKPHLDTMLNNRGISDYRYFGDQDVERREDATVNTLADLDAGRYKFLVFIKPINATRYVGMQVGVLNASADFEELFETETPG
jgi:hypothetical protein